LPNSVNFADEPGGWSIRNPRAEQESSSCRRRKGPGRDRQTEESPLRDVVVARTGTEAESLSFNLTRTLDLNLSRAGRGHARLRDGVTAFDTRLGELGGGMVHRLTLQLQETYCPWRAGEERIDFARCRTDNGRDRDRRETDQKL
ncbi:hypothetical protein CRG98_046023, partial [Punica granatum]